MYVNTFVLNPQLSSRFTFLVLLFTQVILLSLGSIRLSL